MFNKIYMLGFCRFLLGQMKPIYTRQTTEFLHFHFMLLKDFLPTQRLPLNFMEADFVGLTIFPLLGLNILLDFIIRDILTIRSINRHFHLIFLVITT